MKDALFELFLFSAKTMIIVLFALILLAGILILVSYGKEKIKGQIILKNLNKKFSETSENLLQKILSKKEFKKYLKEKNNTEKAQKNIPNKKNIYVLNFHGDIKASAVTALREEINAILSIATPKDEVVIRLESPGGMVNAYGLAAAQLARLRDKKIPLVAAVDKVAASGGYMMACIADKIITAPFSIIGSIGVVVQLPNFHRYLKDKHIDFEQITAGNYKRTLSLFGENTKEGREKMRQEIEEIHHLFKDLIIDYRKGIDIEKVATGEYWLGKQALALKLVDELKTSDDYLLEQSKQANLYEIRYHMKKSWGEKLSATAQAFKENLMGF
jgi:serine protease SohB